jgi:hypothetical protein
VGSGGGLPDAWNSSQEFTFTQTNWERSHFLFSRIQFNLTNPRLLTLLKAALHSIALVDLTIMDGRILSRPEELEKSAEFMKSFLRKSRAGKGKEHSRKQEVASL